MEDRKEDSIVKTLGHVGPLGFEPIQETKAQRELREARVARVNRQASVSFARTNRGEPSYSTQEAVGSFHVPGKFDLRRRNLAERFVRGVERIISGK